MRSFILITALLLCSFSWTSVSGSEFQTVEVHPGEEVTLQCSNISAHPTQTDWFKVVDQSNPSCVSAMFGSDGSASFCDGFQNGKFRMSSNITSVFLQIQQINLSDAGIYFCGFYMNKHTVISNAVELRIQGNSEPRDEGNLNSRVAETCDVNTKLVTVMFASMGIFFMMGSIGLAIKIRQLHPAMKKERHPETNKNVDSLEPNSAALRLIAEIRNRIEREVDTHVVYDVIR
ncbi:uncharacterized protein LOC115797498 [Archocentrus centrarchus]|uniref:uncharacterized protein LOC115797498 n=1 Tax=Archocentrus centrarchus TaxID=63155 RepID=UPI0011E9FBB6|nr:uncharacterized protein LOC115797498 [Archocentrus centrarchus]